MISRIKRCLLLVGLLFSVVVCSTTQAVMPLAKSTVDMSTKNKAIGIVNSVFPEVSVDEVLPAPIPGWFVVASGDQVVYVNVANNLIFQGILIDEKERVNLTDKIKLSIMANALNNFPLENAIPYVTGNGARRLFVFEDPYCKYCRVFTEEVSALTNATVYVILYPVLKRQSMEIAAKIWCSPNRAKAWHDWIVNSKEPKNEGSCKTPLEQNVDLGHRYSVSGTPTIFMVTGQRLSGAPTADEINNLLGD